MPSPSLSRLRASASHSLLRAVAASLWLAASASVAGQQSSISGTAVVLGSVVDAANGQPVPSVIVALDEPNGGVHDTAITGADGQFAFVNLPAGKFRLTASKPGYLEGAFGRTRPGGNETALTLTAGQRLGDVKILVWRPSTISGRITDDSGRPIAGATVTASRALAGRNSLDGFGATTDEAGIFRFAQLTAGNYTLHVTCRSRTTPIPASARVAAPNTEAGATVVDATGKYFATFTGPRPPAATRGEAPMVYVTSFYPGTTLMHDAKPIAVASGEDVRGVDFSIVMLARGQLSGAVVGPNGPVPDAIVRLWPLDTDLSELADDEMTNVSPIASADTAADGSFVFLAAPIGSYLLDAYRPRPPIEGVSISAAGVPQLQVHDYIGTDPEGWRAQDSVSIAAGTRDVTLTMEPLSRTGATVNGTVSIIPPMLLASGLPIPPITISLISARGTGGVSARIPSNRQGPFSIPFVRPGIYELHAAPMLVGFQIVSATIDGRDVLGAPLTVGPGGISGLAVRISNRLNALTGHVVDDQGRAVRDAGVALFPTDVKGWTFVRDSPRIVYRRSGGETFNIEGFPDGEYYIAAMDDALMADWPDPSLLKQIAAHAQRVVVHDGASVTQTLTVVRTLK